MTMQSKCITPRAWARTGNATETVNVSRVQNYEQRAEMMPYSTLLQHEVHAFKAKKEHKGEISYLVSYKQTAQPMNGTQKRNSYESSDLIRSLPILMVNEKIFHFKVFCRRVCPRQFRKVVGVTGGLLSACTAKQ